ncbi:MAG: hypothetical protein ACE5II_06855 [Anaerolineae bacterium]
MDPVTVTLWRDVALIFLVAQGFILILPALFLMFYAFRGLRRAKGSLFPALTSVRERTERVERGAHTFSSFLVSPIIRTVSAGAFVLEVLKVFLRR